MITTGFLATALGGLALSPLAMAGIRIGFGVLRLGIRRSSAMGRERVKREEQAQ